MEKKVIEMYERGMSAVKIAKSLGVTNSKVYWILQKNNVTRRSNKENSRKYDLNHSFFKTIDSEEKAYWLGFMYADGYVSLRKDGCKYVGLSLTADDRGHIEKLNRSLSSTYPINEYVSYMQTDKAIVTIEYSRLLIRSDELFDDLVAKGCKEHKSLILEYPTREQVPKHLIHHFIRGYIDGDGSYGENVKILGTHEFLNGISDEIGHNYSISKHSNSTLGDNEKNSGYITIGGAIRRNEFIKWLYNDATVFMNRKYNKAMQLIQ